MVRYLSLFSGIEAASVAWKPLGWTCVGVAEIDPFPCAVLAHHYPDVPNLGSVTDITDEQIAALGPIDVVVGGSPCQDLSVAGKRAGLAGERSGLFHHQLRIFHAARSFCGARFLVWENVPGAFSSNKGLDFAVVVGTMAGLELDVPADGWGTEGVALGEHGLVEWSVLDAQWFGVAQRRRRVFAVLDVGDWSGRPPILLIPDGMRGDCPTRGEAGKVAPTIPARRTGGGGLDTDFDCDGGLIPAPHDVISPALKARDSKGPSSDGDGDGAILVPMVAHSLRGEGFDASEGGTGRGTPLVPVAVRTANTSANGHGIAENVAHTLDQAQGQCVAFVQNQRDEVRELSVAGALAAEPGMKQQTYVAVPLQEVGKRTGISTDDPRAGVGIGKDGDPMFTLQASAQHGVAFMADDYKDGGYEECDTARPLPTSGDRTRAAPVLAFESRFARNGRGAPSDVVPPLKAQSGESGKGDAAPLLATAMQVRRLTTVECCRLQGFPDDYLLQVPWRGKTPPPDGPMYKALGNSMAVPVMRWIGQRIDEVATEVSA